jgi:hypothetical protein
MAEDTLRAKEPFMRALLVWLAALVCLGPGLFDGTVAADQRAKPAAPLPPYQRLLRGEDTRKAAALERRLDAAWAAGRFQDALQAAEGELALRQNAQGTDHWQTATSRWEVEAWRRVLRQDAATQKKMAAALSLVRRANELEARGHRREAQPLREDLLALLRHALGEEHPATAAAYDNLAGNLYAQGQYAAVEPLVRKALAIQRRALGEDHPDTAGSYVHLASDLSSQRKYAAAEPHYRKALAIRRKVLGEGDADTGTSYENLAENLLLQGKYADAEPLCRRTLSIARKVLGEGHPETVLRYNSLAASLLYQGKDADAEPLCRHALAVARKALGEEHPNTLLSYHNMTALLNVRGEYAAAQPLAERTLAIRRRILGEDNAETGLSYRTLAANLNDQGRYEVAEPLYRQALATLRKALGDDDPATARAYNSVAINLIAQHRYADAEPLVHRAMAIQRRVLGDAHPDTTVTYDTLAHILLAQGKYAEAEHACQQALAISRKALGEGHDLTAISHNNLANTLSAQGRYAAAIPLFRHVLAVRRRVHGDEHADTALSYFNLAADLHAQGEYAEAEQSWVRGAQVFARARLRLAGSGLERSAFSSRESPMPALAAVNARLGKPEGGWRRYEESLARGTWDDLSARLRRSPAERDRQTALVQDLRRLDQLIERAFASKETPELQSRRAELLTRRRHKGDELAALSEQLAKKYGPVAGQVYDRAGIQRALPADAALLGWVDIAGRPKAADPNGEHWAVLLRSRGLPVWQRLRGSGKDGSWTEADTRLPADLRRALLDPSRDADALAERLRVQRLQPLAKQLAAGGGLPAVRRLIVLPSPSLAGVPLEVCTPGHTVSYAPSGTIFAYLRGLPPAAGHGLLALADPVFDAARDKPGRTPLPPGGLLVTVVVPNGNAARARLRADDVLLRYAGGDLKDPADLARLIQQHRQAKDVHVTVWRAGQAAGRTVAGGPLGVALARQPAPAVLAERYKNDELVARSRAAAEGDWPELPGTRVEADALRRLCGAAKLPFRLVAESEASEQELDRLARDKELATYRYVHLATHGDLNDRLPLQSAVILSRDHLPDALKQLEAGRPVYDGRLTAEEVLEKWDLHAELVTLSACETALGKYEGGEGFVGFTQALLLSGARSVCLSLWKVDDTATALLMHRFYANLLGKRKGLTKPLGKAEALAEAKRWLRELGADEAARQAAELTSGVARGKGRRPLVQRPVVPKGAEPKRKRPFAHPYYWSAFVLVGDPN